MANLNIELPILIVALNPNEDPRLVEALVRSLRADPRTLNVSLDHLHVGEIPKASAKPGRGPTKDWTHTCPTCGDFYTFEDVTGAKFCNNPYCSGRKIPLQRIEQSVLEMSQATQGGRNDGD